VRLGPSTPGDYVRARVLVPRNPGVTVSQPLHRVLSKDNRQVRGHHIFGCPSGSGGSGVDGQPASRILLWFIFVNVGDLEVRGPLNGPEAWSKCRYSTRVLLSSMMMSVLGRGVVVMVPRPSPGGATSRSRCRLSPGGLTPCWDAVIPVILFSATDLVLVSSFARSVYGAPRVSPTIDGVL
jgi:hypothetical protein